MFSFLKPKTSTLVREAAEKVLLLMAGPLRGGGAINEKIPLLEPIFFQRSIGHLSSRGEGG